MKRKLKYVMLSTGRQRNTSKSTQSSNMKKTAFVILFENLDHLLSQCVLSETTIFRK